MVDVEVIAPDASGKKVRLLPVGGLLSRGNACSNPQRREAAPQLITNGGSSDSTGRFRDIVTRTADGEETTAISRRMRCCIRHSDRDCVTVWSGALSATLPP